MQDMWVQSLGQEDSLEKDMATHPSILAWEISGTKLEAALGRGGGTGSWGTIS